MSRLGPADDRISKVLIEQGGLLAPTAMFLHQHMFDPENKKYILTEPRYTNPRKRSREPPPEIAGEGIEEFKKENAWLANYMMGLKKAAKEEEDQQKQLMLGEGVECPICYDPVLPVSPPLLVPADNRRNSESVVRDMNPAQSVSIGIVR